MTESELTPSAVAGSMDASFLSTYRVKIEGLETGDERLKEVYSELKGIEEDEEKAAQMNAKLKRALKRIIETCMKKIEGKTVMEQTSNTSHDVDASLAVVDPKVASEKLLFAQSQQEGVDPVLNA